VVVHVQDQVLAHHSQADKTDICLFHVLLLLVALWYDRWTRYNASPARGTSAPRRRPG
jgi:hypothetical protein